MTNQQQKPLSTEQIAGGSRDDSVDNRDQVVQDERRQTQAYADGSGTGNDSRASMEAGYSESGMATSGTTSPAATTSAMQETPALMPVEMLEEHREHWTEIQTRFVDDPRDAVQQADELVAEVMQTVASRFAEQRKSLEGKWQGGGEASSEELRQALLQYRSFFERLLAA